MSGNGDYGKPLRNLSTWTFTRKTHLDEELRLSRLKRDLEERIKQDRIKSQQGSSANGYPGFGQTGPGFGSGGPELEAETKLNNLREFEEFQLGESWFFVL
jgi:hypothetical protein